MKIAITSTGPNLDDTLDPRFGRAQYLLIIDTDTLACESLQNPNVDAGSGAGIRAAQIITGKGVEVLLTGNCGPNASQALAAAGIRVQTNNAGTVREVVERFKREASQSESVS